MIDETDTRVGEPQLPASQIAEESVLGCIMLDPAVITAVWDTLTADHFYYEHTRCVYEVMVSLFNERQEINYLALCNELEQRSRLRLVSERCNIINLFGYVGSPASIERFAARVSDLWRFREETAI